MSVKLHLTYGTSVRPEKAVMFSAGKFKKFKIFVGLSLKSLRCRDPALPPLCGRAYSRPFFLLKARMRIIVWASPRPLFFPARVSLPPLAFATTD